MNRSNFRVFIVLLATLAICAPHFAFSDSWAIRNGITSAIKSEPGFGQHELEIDASRGIVTLSGMVASEGDRQFVDQVARKQRGVSEVRNLITVNSTWDNGGMSAEESKRLAQEIVNLIQQTPQLKFSRIEVRTRGASVELSGQVQSQQIIAKAIAVAQSVPGVRNVSSKLVTQSTAN